MFVLLSFFLCLVVFLAMGNALRFLCGNCGKPAVEEEQAGTESLGPHGVTADTVGVSALAHDLFHFEITSQVKSINQLILHHHHHPLIVYGDLGVSLIALIER